MPERRLSSHVLNSVGFVLVGAITVVDAVTAPVLRPLAGLISRSSPVEAIRQMSHRLPAYVALCMLILPLAVAEPAKIFALYLIGEGHYISGVGTLVGAYLVSLLLVDTIYDGARPQLRSIGWFATIVDWITTIRVAIVSRVRATRAWQSARASIERVRGWIRRRRRRAIPGG